MDAGILKAYFFLSPFSLTVGQIKGKQPGDNVSGE
jgi:hypothetical protein